MKYLLAIESTCDETAAAILDSHNRCLASVVASQEDWHRSFEGVVPEIAARAHLINLLPVLDETIRSSGIAPSDLAAIVVATEPGLPGSLVVGVSAAKALCLAWSLPLVAINHVHAHIYACQLSESKSIFPCVGFVVSGGHTHLYECRSSLEWKYLGGTIDDAAGEAFDKVAVMLGLPFPGGPQLSKMAASGNVHAFAFPRPLLSDKSRLDFSFSGLKTAVRYQLVGSGKQNFSDLKLSEAYKADIAASFQQSVIDCLIGKAILALKKTGLTQLCVGGGVASNSEFRLQLTDACQKAGFQLSIAAKELCTDNAVMGAMAWERIRVGDFSSLDIDIRPGLIRHST